MDQFDLNRLKSSFSSLIEGTTTGEEEYESLKVLLAKYPYCQPLQIIHAASLRNDPDKFKQQLSKAAAYTPDRNVLYKYIYQNEQFYKVVPESVEPDPVDEIQSESNTPPAIEIVLTDDPQEEVLNETEEAMPEESQVTLEDPDTATEEEPIETIAEVDLAEKTEDKKQAEEPPIFDNIASSDYFTFNKSTVDPLSKLESEKEPVNSSALQEPEVIRGVSQTELLDQNTIDEVSKYHDEELPYTFLWWLHKTRKEHAHTYQPYANLRTQASEALRKSSVDELNHQIIENIFHLQVPLKDEKSSPSSANTIEFELKRQDKKDYLIERFIKEEPQIRPPKAENLDTENKARKSSEDNLDLVSETLAHIYIEQMLYHKAIDTYKKLSLKFPEKSTYFADQINEIQKKIS